MEVIYTKHLEFRLKVRNISHNLPREIFQQAEEHYYDNLTNHYVAIRKIEFEGKSREMVVIYDRKKGLVEIITIHPLKSYQKYSRIISRRWKKI